MCKSLSHETINILTEPFNWIYLAHPENIEGYKRLGIVAATDFKTLNDPITIAGKCQFKIEPKLWPPDTKGAQMSSGTSVGGYYGCSFCYIHRMYIHNYVTSLTAKPRNWLQTFKNVNTQTGEDPTFGDDRVPIWCMSDSPDNNYGPEQLEVGCCLLHIIEGHSELIFQRIRDSVTHGQKVAFKTKVEEVLNVSNGDLSCNMSCHKWREFWFMHEQILLPDFWNGQMQMYNNIYHLAESLAIIFHQYYSTLSCQQKDRRRAILLLYVATWYHCQLIRQCWPYSKHPSLYGNHFHQMDSHVPFLSRRFHLSNLVAERNEASWRHERITEIQCSNHQDNQIANILLRTINRKERLGFSNATKKEKQPSNPNPDFVIPANMAATLEFTYLLWTIRDYEEEIWFTCQSNGDWKFFTSSTRDIGEQPTTPQSLSFENMTAQEAMDAIQAQYERIKTNSPHLQSVQRIEAAKIVINDTVSLPSDYNEWSAEMLRNEIKRRRNEEQDQQQKSKLVVTGKKDVLVQRLGEHDTFMLSQTELTEEEEETVALVFTMEQ